MGSDAKEIAKGVDVKGLWPVLYFVLFLSSHVFAQDFTSAQSAYQKGEWAEAEKICRDILKQHERDLDTRLLLVRVLYFQGQVEKAWAHWESALKIEKSAYVYETAADLAYWDQDFEKSLKYIDLALGSQSDVPLLAKKARMLIKLGRIDEAKELAAIIEKQAGKKYQSYYFELMMGLYNKQVGLEAGFTDFDSGIEDTRHFQLNWRHELEKIGYGLYLTRDFEFDTRGTQVAADVTAQLPWASYIYSSVSYSKDDIFPEYSLSLEGHKGIEDWGEVGIGYEFSKYTTAITRSWMFTGTYFWQDLSATLTGRYTPTNYSQNGRSLYAGLRWTPHFQWKLGPYVSFGQEVSDSQYRVFDVTHFQEVGVRIDYRVSPRIGTYLNLTHRYEKQLRVSSRNSDGFIVGSDLYF